MERKRKGFGLSGHGRTSGWNGLLPDGPDDEAAYWKVWGCAKASKAG